MARKPGFGADIAAEILAETKGGTQPQLPRGDVLKSRSTAAARFGDNEQYITAEWLDPTTCKPSAENARHYDALTYDDCAELIESIKTEGHQLEPALVRPVEDPEFRYEIIAGLRRHWAISWLRANHYPNFRYLVRAEKMDDETAFRRSDIENRVRSDITDYERATSYRRALDLHYGGVISQMADRMSLHQRNLRRYIDLANLPQALIDAVGSREITVSFTRDIGPLMAKSAEHKERVLAEAEAIADERAGRAGQGAIAQADVLRRLKAASEKPVAKAGTFVDLPSKSGGTLLGYMAPQRRAGLAIKIPAKPSGTADEIKEALGELVDRYYKERR